MTGAFNFKCKIAFLHLWEAYAAGYKETGEEAFQSGYVSANTDYCETPVYIAGKGKQAGKLFYVANNPKSTRYCIRVYLGKGGGKA